MRAPEPMAPLSSSLRPLRWIALLAASVGGFAACADSIHLDPGGGTGGKTTTTSTSSSTTTTNVGGGGAAPTLCASNQDCGFPEPLCDAVAGTCVECLTVSDCAETKPGTVCSFGKCVCAPDEGGADLTYCPATSGVGHCVDTQTSPNDCGECGKKCFGSCAAGACVDKWRPIATAGAPSARSRHVSVWAASDKRMFVWGGRATGSSGSSLDTGGLYDPVKDTWKAITPVNAPSPRWGATAVWDDKENVVIVWGGVGAAGQPLADGGMYNPATDTWTTIPPGVPAARHGHTAVWATFTTPFMGSSYGMMVWGGEGTGGYLGDGAFFDPTKMTWLALEAGPAPRRDHTAVWSTATNVMIIFGGYGGVAPPDDFLGDAWSFDPLKTGAGPWTDLTPAYPSARARQTAVFGSPSPTTAFMVLFGGANATNQLPDGAIYRANAFSPLDPQHFPEAREGHTAVWMDAPVSRMIVLGGVQGGTTLGSAWSLDVTGSTTWSVLPTPPGTRAYHTAVTDGASMMAWGGESFGSPLNTGVIYTP
jgi:hypothetical protein